MKIRMPVLCLLVSAAALLVGCATPPTATGQSHLEVQ
jgi:type IV pilus biogenesis protein CpaD/CtpE